jgi:hypothetical protein
MPQDRTPILESLPPPQTIRARISELGREANYLRRLLRLVVQRPPSSGPVSSTRDQEVRSAS